MYIVVAESITPKIAFYRLVAFRFYPLVAELQSPARMSAERGHLRPRTACVERAMVQNDQWLTFDLVLFSETYR